MSYVKFITSIYTLLCLLILFPSCINRNNHNIEQQGKLTHITKNSNDNINIDHNYISEFKTAIQDDITIPDTYITSIDVLNTLSGKSLAEQYNILAELFNTLPKPYMETSYKEKYNSVLAYLDKLYNSTAKPVPKILHFVWLGGPLGNAQIDYIKIWATMNPDYQIQIWYDPKNMFTYETQKSLKEHLGVSLLQYKNDTNYEQIFANKFINLQNELFAYIEKELKKNQAAEKDFIRVEFIDHIIYKKPHDKIAARKMQDNIAKMKNDIEILEKNFSHLKFKNIRNEIPQWEMKEIYEHELDLRGNFAAASDLFRLYVGEKFGGVYADVDLLPTMIPIYEFMEHNPALKNSLAINLKTIKQAFFNEIILNNKQLIPSYSITENYSLKNLQGKMKQIINNKDFELNYKEAIKDLDQKLITLAKDAKYLDLNNLFYKLGDVLVREGEFKIIRENNSFIVSHPTKTKNDWLNQLVEKIKNKYLQVFTSENNNPELKLAHQNTGAVSQGTVAYYRFDGLLIDSDATISISGPYVFSEIYDKVAKSNPVVSYSYLNKLFNSFTPEAADSSWFKRMNDLDRSRKSIILQMGKEQNIAVAAENIFNKFKDQADIYLFENNKFENLLDTDSDDEDYEIMANRHESNRVDLHLIGHSEIVSSDKILIGGITADNLALRIKENIFQIISPKRLDYISLVSCNPSGNANDTSLLESYAKNLLNALNDLGIPVQVASIRTTDVRVDKNGEKFYLHGKNYTGHREGDKLYILRKNQNDYLTIQASYLPKDFNKKLITDVKSYLSNLPKNVTELIEDGASGPLGEFSKVINSLGTVYQTRTTAESLAKIIKHVTVAVRDRYNLNSQYAPLFSTLNKEKNLISFVNTVTGDLKRDLILTVEENQHFNEIWQKLNTEMLKLKTIPIKTDENGILSSLNEADGLGITPLLLAQTLYGLFKTNTENMDENIYFDPALGKLIKVQNYLLFSQIGYDVFSKVRQVENIISALIKTDIITEEQSIIPNINQLIGKLTAARYLTPGFSFASVALDAFEYSYAKGPQKSLFATQFSFDALNASMTLGSLVLGEGVAASVLGYLGTPFAGLAIGFTGFASAAVEAQEESMQIAKFFNEYLHDHNRYGKLLDCSSELDLISLAHSRYYKTSNNSCAANLNTAVIHKVDLTTDNIIKIFYGSHHLHKTKNWHKGIFNNYFSNFQGSSKFPIVDPINTFSVRESLGIQATANIPIRENTIIMLPFLMEKNISYGYSYTPGIMTRNDAELFVVNTLEKNKNSQFVFRYFVDLFEYTIRNLHFETKLADIHIILGSQRRTLITPHIPREYHNKVVYNIEGGNGKYSLEIGNNAIYNLQTMENDEWTLDLSLLKSAIKFVNKGEFIIDSNSRILIAGRMSKNLTIKEFNKTYQLNPYSGEITNIIETDMTETNQTEFINDLKKTTAHFEKHEGVVKINNYKVNNIVKPAWYNIGSQEIYTPNLAMEKYFNFSETFYLGKKEKTVYYFDRLSRIVFQQNLLKSNDKNTFPLLQVSKNTEPHYDVQNDLLIYKTSISAIPGIYADWEFTIGRSQQRRLLLQIEIKDNSRTKQHMISMETILNKQKSFQIIQPVKVTARSHNFIAWYLKANADFPNGKLLVTSKEIINPEYAGYLKKKDGKFVFFFTSRDPISLRLSLFKQDADSQKAIEMNLNDLTHNSQKIISFSVMNNKPIVLTSEYYMYSLNDDEEVILIGINFSLLAKQINDLKTSIENILKSQIKHSEIITILDSSGSLAWYDFQKDLFILFDPTKKYLGRDPENNFYFLAADTKKVYYRHIKSGNLKNYSLSLKENKITFNTTNRDEELQLLTNRTPFIDITQVTDKYNNFNINDAEEYLAKSFINNEKDETKKAQKVFSKILTQAAFKEKQDKLDTQIPTGGTQRRSIIFVNDAWYNSSIEIVLEDNNGKIRNFHSWWGQKSSYTVTPLIPITTKIITVSIQSFFFGWSRPFFVGKFKLSDLPLCLNAVGTLFYRDVTVRNCNEKH